MDHPNEARYCFLHFHHVLSLDSLHFLTERYVAERRPHACIVFKGGLKNYSLFVQFL
jgi:hypothetical protein